MLDWIACSYNFASHPRSPSWVKWYQSLGLELRRKGSEVRVSQEDIAPMDSSFGEAAEN